MLPGTRKGVGVKVQEIEKMEESIMEVKIRMDQEEWE